MSKRDRQGERDDEAVAVPLVRPYGRMLLGLVGTGACGAFMLHEAQENVRGLIINGIIHLDPGQADVFYLVCGVLCLAIAVLMALSLYAIRPGVPFRMIIADDEVILPRSPLWKSGGEAVAPLDDVVGVEFRNHSRQQVLVIVTNSSGRFALPTNYLPKEWSPTRIADLIIAGARRAAKARQSPSP